MLFAADPASRSFGWAILDPSRPRRPLVDAGTWEIWSSKDDYHLKKGNRHAGLRWVRLVDHLERTLEMVPGIESVVYELVRRHTGTKSAQQWGGARGHLVAWACRHNLPVHTVSVQDIKMAATGKGNAGKDAVLSAIRERFRHHTFDTDDAADAASAGLAHLHGQGIPVLRDPQKGLPL